MVKNDMDLVFFRSENSRMSLKDLSKALRKSPQRLKYSISVMEKESILKLPHCVFDYSFFGLVLFKVYFRGSYVKEEDKLNIINTLSKNPYITSLYELTGEFDLAVEFACPNPSRFNKELRLISSSIPTLNNYNIVLNLVTYISPRRYLTQNENFRSQFSEKVIGGDREKLEFNSNEFAVMKSILLSPNSSVSSLAKISDLNVKTVKSALSSLAKRNIVRGFKFVIDTNKLGINKFIFFLKLHNLTLDKESQLMKFLLSSAEVTQVNKTVGDWDMEIDVEVFDKNKVRGLMTHIRDEFKDIIEGFKTIDFYDYYKKKYLPMYLFEKG